VENENMNDRSIQQVEREVETARAKLAGDLATIRSPATFAEFTSDLKHEAVDLKDALVDKAKASVQSTFDDLIEDVKARVAANPAAALAIGAGIAWRLLNRPPIATALVGAGLYSLFRTSRAQYTPTDTTDYLAHAKTRLGEQAVEFAGTVKERAVEMGEAAAAKAGELASDAIDRASAIGESAKSMASEIAGSVTGSAQQWTAGAQSSGQQISQEVKSAMVSASATVDEMRRTAADAAQRTVARAGAVAEDPEARDKLLLGAAGFAVIAALGIACQRRLNEPAQAE
jgi:hypothetical protein